MRGAFATIEFVLSEMVANAYALELYAALRPGVFLRITIYFMFLDSAFQL